MSGNSIILIGGPQSGKSTFTGGLIQHLLYERGRHEGGDYHLMDDEFRDDFEVRLLNSMIEDHRYPGRTINYAVSIHVPGRQYKLFPKHEELHVHDLGGELQNQLLGESQNKINLTPFSEADGNIENTSFSSIVENNDGRPNEDDRLFLNELRDSYGIIFLMNLKKYMDLANDSEDDNKFEKKGHLAPQSLETDLVKNKQKKALVVTGCDCIGYVPDPDKRELQPGFFGGPMYDQELYNEVKKEFQDARILNIFNKADRKEEFDLFGVAVPEDPDDNESLKTKDGVFVTQGFETVIRWIRK